MSVQLRDTRAALQAIYMAVCARMSALTFGADQRLAPGSGTDASRPRSHCGLKDHRYGVRLPSLRSAAPFAVFLPLFHDRLISLLFTIVFNQMLTDIEDCYKMTAREGARSLRLGGMILLSSGA